MYGKNRANEIKEMLKVANVGQKRKSHSDRMKRLWKTSEYVSRQIQARNVCPNKSEQKLMELLERWFPGEWEFVGDGSLIIAGKNPDFVHKTEKRLIELFGEPFHEKEEEEGRIQLFMKEGYNMVVIWCEDMKSGYSHVREKIESVHQR